MIFNCLSTSCRDLSRPVIRQFFKKPAAIAIAMILTPGAAFAACGDATGTTTVNVVCQAASGNAEVNADDLDINITGTGTAIDVSATAGSAIVNINNSTMMVNPVSGTGNQGIRAWVGASSAGDRIINLTGTNTITVDGLGDTGIVANDSSAGGNSIITIGGELTLTNNVDNASYADGVETNATDATSSIVHTGSGTITVHGGNALLSNSTGTGNSRIEVGSGVHLVVNNTVSGANAAYVNSGIRASSEFQIEIDSAAKIDTLGDNAHGIAAYLARAGISTSVRNSGAIQTTGTGSHGVYSTASASSVIDVVNSGVIQTSGSASHGIYSTAGTVSIANNANMTTTGAGSYGIYARAAGSDTITVTGNGSITTTSDSYTDRSYGIFASSLNGFNQVIYSGEIATKALDSSGIRAAATGTGDVEVIYTGSRIEAFSDNADGIHASTRAGSTKVSAIGTIITHAKLNGADDGTGHAAFGIAALSSQGNVEATFTGDLIDVNGLDSAAFYGDSKYGSSGTGVGTVSLTNTGKLVTRGENGSGIQAFSTIGAMTIIMPEKLRLWVTAGPASLLKPMALRISILPTAARSVRPAWPPAVFRPRRRAAV